MKFVGLTSDDVIAGMTDDPEEALTPFLDTLEIWATGSHVVRKPWEDYEVGLEAGRVTIDGFPMHDYVQGRMLTRTVGIRGDKLERWHREPDLILEAMKRFDVFKGDVTMRAVAGKVVVLTDIDLEFGDHLDYFDPMVEAVHKAAKRGTPTPVALTGYLLDPLWAHARLAFISPNRDQPHHVGMYLDANYLFNRHVRGRACYGLVAYDMTWELGMVMDDWFSVRTPRIREDRQDIDIHQSFVDGLERHKNRVRREVGKASGSLTSRRNRKATPIWKNNVTSYYTKNHGAKGRVQEALLELDEKGMNNPFDYGMCLLTVLDRVPHYKRMSGERFISKKLRGLT